MSDRGAGRSSEVLQRLLLALPVAFRDEGASVAELARDLGVSPRRLLRDLKEVDERAFYLHSGLGDSIRLALTSERLEVWTTGDFRRPARLTPRETLALDLSLRVLATRSGEATRPGIDQIRERLVSELRSPVPEGQVEPAVELGDGHHRSDPLRSRIEDALTRGLELEVAYAAPGREPARRTVGPVQLVHAEGKWYLLAREMAEGGHRALRLDRILEVETGERNFRATVRDRAAAERFIRDGWIHDGGAGGGGQPTRVVVEYSSGIAPWIRERGWEEMEELPNGAVRVGHDVFDDEWLVRHVLSYGGEAVVTHPEEIRRKVRDRALRIAEGSE